MLNCVLFSYRCVVFLLWVFYAAVNYNNISKIMWNELIIHEANNVYRFCNVSNTVYDVYLREMYNLNRL